MGIIETTVTKGIFRFVTGKIARKKPSNMRIKVPSGGIGIRGTDLIVRVSPVGDAHIQVLRGLVEVKPKGGEGALSIRAGYEARLSHDGRFTSPRRIDVQQAIRAWKRETAAPSLDSLVLAR